MAFVTSKREKSSLAILPIRDSSPHRNGDGKRQNFWSNLKSKIVRRTKSPNVQTTKPELFDPIKHAVQDSNASIKFTPCSNMARLDQGKT